MKRRCWRLVKARHQAHAVDGEGARRYGGRWNSPGVPVVYTASSVSLAALELLVHLEAADLLRAYRLFELVFDHTGLAPIEPAKLPRRWRAGDAPVELRALGDAWASAGRSLALEVPSAIVPEETLVLLNPQHPAFRKVKVSQGKPFLYDPRLVK